MCIGLNYEYTDAVKNVKRKNLSQEKKQRAAVLQLSVASKTLVFQICHADAVSELLREFLNNDAIMFWGAAIQHDVHMLENYRITIFGARDLQREIPNPTFNYLWQMHTLRPIFLKMIRR
jgi:hypothetical protein